MKLLTAMVMDEFTPSGVSYWERDVDLNHIGYKLKNPDSINEDVFLHYDTNDYDNIPIEELDRYDEMEDKYLKAIKSKDWKKFKEYCNNDNYKNLLPKNYISVFSSEAMIEIGRLEITEKTFSLIEEFMHQDLDWENI